MSTEEACFVFCLFVWMKYQEAEVSVFISSCFWNIFLCLIKVMELDEVFAHWVEMVWGRW